METRITVAELTASLAEVLARVCEHGERFVIEEDGRVIAALGPQPAGPRRTAREVFAGLEGVHMPGDGYADDLEWAIKNQGPLPEPPAWPD